ncbi:MAG: C25 family cysteine peptidase, partial [Xanthomonadales bacterium]|nr:C25 family cysteine peptidase [Xanthomonadales bacterium]
WPVRTQGDLEAIVTKTLDWTSIDNPESAIWVTDSEDSRSGSFTAQADRMIAPLAEAGWDEARLDRVYFADVAQRPGASRADSARMNLFDQLEQGRALTGFVGHGSPAMWTFQGLLTPDDIKDLYNDGNPTLIGTMTCYTSYFVSPESDTVAHRWMNGYRENAAGARIEGVPNGAVAIHGAATLSQYRGNEIFARKVQELQLAGETLGRATLIARREAQANRMTDNVINWTLLGDPTLTLQSE